jgi:hypothetical protein
MVNNFSGTSRTPLLSPSQVAESRASINFNTSARSAVRLSSIAAAAANLQERVDDANVISRANALLTRCYEEQIANPGFSKGQLRAFVEARNAGEWENATHILSELLSIDNNTRSRVKKAGAVDAMGGLFMASVAAIFPAYILSQDRDSLTEHTETNAAISLTLAALLPLITPYVNAGTELLGGAIQERILAHNPSLQPAKLSSVSASTTAHPDPLTELSTKLNQFENTIAQLNQTKQALSGGEQVETQEIEVITTALKELLIEKDKSSTAYQLKKEIQNLTTTGQTAQIYWRLLGVLTSLASLTAVNKHNPYISPAITVGYTLLSFVASPLLGRMDANHKLDQMLAIVAKNIALKAEDGSKIDLAYLDTPGANMEKIKVPELQALLPQPTMAKFALFKERLEYEIWKAERAPDTTPTSPRSNLPATVRMPRHEVLKQDLNKLSISADATDQWSQVSIGTLRELCAFMESDSSMTKAWSITRARIMTRAKYVPEVAQRFSSNLQLSNFTGGLLPNLTLATINMINAAEKDVAATTPQDPAISANANIAAMTVLLVSNAIWTALYPDRIRTKAETRTALGLEENKYGTLSAQVSEGFRASLAQWYSVLPQAIDSIKAKYTVWQSQALPDTLGKKGAEIQQAFTSNARARKEALGNELQDLTNLIGEIDKNIADLLPLAKRMHTDAAEIDIRSQDKSTATQMEMAQTAATTAQKMRTDVSTIITPTEQSQLDQLAQALSAIQAHLQTAENAVSQITDAREKVADTSATLAALKEEIMEIEVPDVEKQQEEKIILGDKIVTQNTSLSNLEASLKDLLDVTGNRSDMRQSSQDESWELATEPLNNAVEKTMANALALQNEIDTTSELTQQKITETQEQSEHIGMHFGSAEKSLQLIQTAVKEVTQQLDDARKNFEQTKNNSVEEQA